VVLANTRQFLAGRRYLEWKQWTLPVLGSSWQASRQEAEYKRQKAGGRRRQNRESSQLHFTLA